MVKKSFVIIFYISILVHIYGVDLHISVIDRDLDIPLEGVRIREADSAFEIYTDINGNCIIIAELIGYEHRKQLITDFDNTLLIGLLMDGILEGQELIAGLKVHSLGEHRMERAMETEASERINALESGFDLLVAVGSIAPITGFLGTVSGMIGAFQSIANAADVNAQLVAGGIFEALITTAFGLIIAIVAITAYNIFAHIVDKFAAEVEEGGSNIVTRILMQEQIGK